MAKLASGAMTAKSSGTPDEVREFADGMGRMEVVHLPCGDVGKGTFPPGWRWSSHLKPIAGTDSCEVEHVGYIVAGRMTVRMDDGTESHLGPGDFAYIPPGHDAWVDGEETCEFLDFGGLAGYAQPH
jgi:mannose-6-phosphate isomerase-like protein (cupin superfamily)